MKKLLFLLAIVCILTLVAIAQAQQATIADQEKAMEFRVERMAAQVAMLDQQISESLKKRQDLNRAIGQGIVELQRIRAEIKAEPAKGE